MDFVLKFVNLFLRWIFPEFLLDHIAIYLDLKEDKKKFWRYHVIVKNPYIDAFWGSNYIDAFWGFHNYIGLHRCFLRFPCVSFLKGWEKKRISFSRCDIDASEARASDAYLDANGVSAGCPTRSVTAGAAADGNEKRKSTAKRNDDHFFWGGMVVI